MTSILVFACACMPSWSPLTSVQVVRAVHCQVRGPGEGAANSAGVPALQVQTVQSAVKPQGLEQGTLCRHCSGIYKQLPAAAGNQNQLLAAALVQPDSAVYQN